MCKKNWFGCQSLLVGFLLLTCALVSVSAGGQPPAAGIGVNHGNPGAHPVPAPSLPPTVATAPTALPAESPSPSAPLPTPNIDASALLPNLPEVQFLQNLARDLESLQNNALVRFLKEMFKDAELRQAFLSILQDQNWRALAIYEIVFLLFVFLLRQLEYSKLGKGQFLKRIWIGVWTTLFTFFGTVLLLPSVHFGQPYIKILRAIGAALGLPV